MMVYWRVLGVITGAARYDRGADIGLSFEQADGCFEIPAWPMKVRGRRHLFVGSRARQGPVRYGGVLSGQPLIWRDAQNYQEQRRLPRAFEEEARGTQVHNERTLAELLRQFQPRYFSSRVCDKVMASLITADVRFHKA